MRHMNASEVAVAKQNSIEVFRWEASAASPLYRGTAVRVDLVRDDEEAEAEAWRRLRAEKSRAAGEGGDGDSRGDDYRDESGSRSRRWEWGWEVVPWTEGESVERIKRRLLWNAVVVRLACKVATLD